MVEIELKRVSGDYGFEVVDSCGQKVKTDVSLDHGGENNGVRPMQMLLMALASCSGIDVISILKKQRQEVTDFSIKVSGERETGKDLNLWKTAHMIFEIGGEVDPEKASRACALSIEKYCSVAETLRLAGCKITWEVKLTN